MEQLINETVESYNEYLGNLPKGCTAISDKIRQNNMSDALNEILNFSQGISWLTEVGVMLRLQNIDVQLDVSPIQEFLSEINDALAIQDYTLVADLFEYELAPFFEEVQVIQK